MNKKAFISIGFLAILISLLYLTSCSGGSNKSPKYPYTDWQIYHLAGNEEQLYWDENYFIVPPSELKQNRGHMTRSFDQNGNLRFCSNSLGEKVEGYKYFKKGYEVYGRLNTRLGEWDVVCDTTLRMRADIHSCENYGNESFIYTFDTKGRHKSTLYAKSDYKVLIVFHYPDERPFRPGNLWKGKNLGRSRGSRGSIWYAQLDKNGEWREEIHEAKDNATGYYTAHYVINGDGYQGEGVIATYKLTSLMQYRNKHVGDRFSLARKCKPGETEFEKAIVGLGVFDSDGEILVDSSMKSPLAKVARRISKSKSKTVDEGEHASIIDGLGLTTDQHFLSNVINIPIETQNILGNILCAILCLAALFFVVTFKEAKGTYTCKKDVDFVKAIILFLSLCELAFFYLCPDAEPFVAKMSGIWKLLPIAGFIFLVIGQISATAKLLVLGDKFSGRNAPLYFFYFGCIVFMVALIISLFAEDLRPYALAIGFVTIGLQLVIDLIATIVNHASIGSFLLHAIWMIVCCSAIMLLAYGLAVFFIIIFIGYAFLSGLSHSGEPCCSNCCTYNNGYCHYRNEYMGGGDCCSKHMW